MCIIGYYKVIILTNPTKKNTLFLFKIYQLDITFLGTGTSQGIPIIGSNHPVCLSDNIKDKRLRSSISISHNDIDILIDCGPDFRQQAIRAKLKKIIGN